MLAVPDSPEPSTRDPLTGLATEGEFHQVLERWSEEAAQGTIPAPVHALALGLGRFDAVNVAYGEAAGDDALAEIARRLLHIGSDELADAEWVAVRLGGGKFAIAARQPLSRERWEWFGEAVADAVASPIAAIGGGTVRLRPRTALLRVVPGETAGHVLDRLAATLDLARDRSGSRVMWADRFANPAGIRASELEADLISALDRNEIEIVFQPQYNLGDGGIVGAEALARWRHPRVGLVGANALFAIAERADHVAQLSRHVAERALAAAGNWPEGLRLSLNLTPADLATRDFAASFAAVLRHAGFDPCRLTLEITEQALLGDIQQVAATLAQLRETGVRIALDDFGGGFCNFQYLKVLPLDAIKLDRSMIEGIDVDVRDRAILRAIVALARVLDLSIVAEGIETEAQRTIAASEGCSTFQGFLGSAPLDPGRFERLAAA